MIKEKKRYVIKVFLVIYLMFGMALVYLLFFNQGMALSEPKIDSSEGQLKIDFNVFNESQHLIRGITVMISKDGQTFELEKIELLEPNQNKEVTLTTSMPQSNQIEVMIAAPFHNSVSKLISVGAQTATNISFSLTGIDSTFVGQKYDLTLTVCNSGATAGNPAVTVSFDPTQAKKISSPQESFALEATQCKQLEYAFEALKAGTTTIYFNINANDITKTTQKTIEVKE